MPKNYKLILWIAIPILVLLVGFLIMTSGPNPRTIRPIKEMSTGSFGMNMQMTANKAVPSVMPMEAREEMVMMDSVDYDDEGSNFDMEDGEETDRLIIKTGSVAMVVEDVKDSVQIISDYAKANEGFVVSSNVYKQGVGLSGHVTIRIPSEKFDEKIEDIKQMGEVTSESVNGQDVTEEYVDLEAQMKNLKATETQFLEIMRRAYEIEDVLAVQRELTNVRERIERIEGRMKYLTESASLSTLTIHLSTDPDNLPALDETDKWKPFGVVKNAFRSLLSVVKSFANLIIWLIIYIPLWIVIGLVVWLTVKTIKRKM